MSQLLDSNVLVYVILALVPNLLLMLWAMARMHRDVRLVTAKLGLVEADNRMLDGGLKALSDEIQRLRQSQAGPGRAPTVETLAPDILENERQAL